jgi:hypothetical protein
MRLLAGFALLGSLVVSAPSFAQAKSDLELSRDVLQAQRKLVVSQNMTLTDAEGKAFWPVYDAYAAEQRKLNDRLVVLLESFATDYETLTDDRARTLLDESLSLREDRSKLRRDYLKKFEKTLPGKKLARFYQIDNKIDTLLDLEIAKTMPLVH